MYTILHSIAINTTLELFVNTHTNVMFPGYSIQQGSKPCTCPQETARVAPHAGGGRYSTTTTTHSSATTPSLLHGGGALVKETQQV